MKKQKFNVHRKILSNGMNVLVRPVHAIPEVSVQLWYNVGAKDEADCERGMAHLIEHMIFKGTEKLSEIDIDLITSKFSGYANASTSNDYTMYLFKFPSNVWEKALLILSDCMQNARFEEQMLNSELHTVVQELKLYKDDYQETLFERMLAGIFPQHPYHHPIIGYKQDLLSLQRDTLYAFYKKHYHPANATLVIVGDVKKSEVFTQVEKYFGAIPSSLGYEKRENAFLDDIYRVSVSLPREIEAPWAYYSFVIPGISEKKAYLFDMIKLLLGGGRSSRLYEKLVNENKLATFVGCFSYNLFEKGLFFIYVQPVSIESLPRIEMLIDEELQNLAVTLIEEWEFYCVKKKTEFLYFSLLENIEHQAELLGYSFLATGDTQYLTTYMESVRITKRADIQKGIEKYITPALCHRGYLISANDKEKELWKKSQEISDVLDRKILQARVRKTAVEGGKLVTSIKEQDLPTFTYPSPKTFVLDNGLEVVLLNRVAVPKISILLGLKANYLNETEEFGGMSTFMSRLLLEGTRNYSPKELSRYLESEGIYISVSSGLISVEVLSENFIKGLEILYEIVSDPKFREESVEKIRREIIAELQEYWNTPTLFVEALARKVIYKGHPYEKNSLGYKECVERFTRAQIADFYEENVSPQEANLIIVGDLNNHGEEKCMRIISKIFGKWKGKKISDLYFPEISYKEPKIVRHVINRDQVVLAFTAPSVTRMDKDYDALAVLDFILTGAGIVSTSRLYQLREQTGLFYTIGGSLLYGAGRAEGMMLIKTVVSLDNVSKAEKLIKKTIKNLQENGISQGELAVAVKSLMTASVRGFERNMHIAKIFLFLKRCGMNLDLFDKRGALLSILKVGVVNNIARCYCKENFFSTILVGRKAD